MMNVPPRQAARSRAGSSLIETMELMSVSSTLLLIAVGWIHQSFRLADVLRGHERHHQSLMRLSRQFRDDAHAAQGAEANDSEVVFTIDEVEVRYHAEGNVVRRSLFSESTNAIRAEEIYQLRDRAAVSLSLEEQPQRASLVVYRRGPSESAQEDDRPHDAPVAIPQDLAIRVAVGRWNSFAIDLHANSASRETP